MKSQKSIVLKHNMKNLMTTLLRMIKKIIGDKINQVKSGIAQKIRPKKIKERRNIPKRVSNRGIKSLESNFNVKATKNIINTPKIDIEKTQIVNKTEIATKPKIARKVEKVSKPKLADKSEIVIEKKYLNYGEYKNRVIKQFKKKLFDTT